MNVIVYLSICCTIFFFQCNGCLHVSVKEEGPFFGREAGADSSNILQLKRLLSCEYYAFVMGNFFLIGVVMYYVTKNA